MALEGAMRYLALASDYDGTLARHGVVDEQTVPALERLAQSGRKIVLVTGRELPDLESVLDRFDLFARIVAENGAVLSQRSAAPSRQNSVLSRMLNASVDHPHAFWTPPLHFDRPIARD